MIKNMMRYVYSFAKGVLTSPPTSQTMMTRELSIRKENLEIISCSNIVLHIKTKDEDGFLSECRLHQPLREYVFRFIDDYFSCFCGNDSEKDKQLIVESLQIPDNFARFTDIGTQSPYTDSPYRRYMQNDAADEIGINLSGADEKQKTRVRRFVERYAWPQLTAYYTHRRTPIGEYHCRTTAKVLATEAMAKLIGLGNTIPHAEYMKVIVTDANDLSMFGNYMQRAAGICAMDIPAQRRRTVITPEFQRAMLNMNLLDVICHEQDHSPNNYNVVCNEQGKAVGVSVYDNNGAGTFSLYSRIDYETYKKCSAFVSSDGTVNRPHLDKAVAEAVLGLSYRQISMELSPFLSRPVIWCTWRRLTTLRRAIRKSIESKEHFLLDYTEFTEQTIEDELSGTYGKTYLVSFLQDCQERASYR